MKYLIISILLVVNLFATKILILNSYRSNLQWTHDQTEAILANLEKSYKKDIHIFTEFMDTKIFRPTLKSEQNYINFFTNKYQNIKFDLVITTDDNALKFIQKYKNQTIFKKAKIFFCGVNNLSLYNHLDKNIYAGVFEKKNPLGNLTLARQIKPNLKTIYLISDDTITSKQLIKEYKNTFKNIKNINFIYISHKNIENIFKELNHYDKNSVAMLLAFTSIYNNNKHLSTKEFNNELIKKYKEPLLIHTSSFIYMKNVIGGNCVSAKEQADIVIKKAILYIDDTPMDKIGFKLNSPNLYYINVKNINNFGIDIKDINIKNIHLVNKPNSFYSLYSTWINSFIVIIVLILIFLVTIINKNIQLKKTSALLKNTLNRFEILLNSSLEGIVIFDDKHRCININEKGCEIFKIKDKDSALGLSLFDYIHPDSLSTIIKNLKINYTKPYEVLLYRIDKSTYPALVQGRNAVFDGEEVRIVSILDISDIKEKEQMLLQHFRLAQMGEMIGMIAHQWRQPLGAITARVANLSLKLMLKKEITPKTLQAELSKINQYSQHLSSTIDDFRNFFKINKKRNKTSFNKIIEKTLLLIEEPLKNKDITIIKELNSDKEFLTYENEITQVILNLIKNAEDILLENRIKNPTITIITIENKIIIKDNGKGVPKDIINKIFDPYFSTKLKKDGTGLGLYMSKTIIEEHCNGKLSVRNEDGIGAVFTIKLDNI